MLTGPSIYGVPWRLKNFVPAESNTEVNGMCGPIGALGCLFRQFWDKHGAGTFANVVYSKLNVANEKHWYGRPTGLTRV